MNLEFILETYVENFIKKPNGGKLYVILGYTLLEDFKIEIYLYDKNYNESYANIYNIKDFDNSIFKLKNLNIIMDNDTFILEGKNKNVLGSTNFVNHLYRLKIKLEPESDIMGILINFINKDSIKPINEIDLIYNKDIEDKIAEKIANKYMKKYYKNHEEELNNVFDETVTRMMYGLVNREINKLFPNIYDSLEKLLIKHMKINSNVIQSTFDNQIKEELELISKRVIVDEIENFINVKGLIRDIIKKYRED